MNRYSKKSLRSTSHLDALKAEILPAELGHFDNSRFRRTEVAQQPLTGLPQFGLVFPPVLACSDPFSSPLPATTCLSGPHLTTSVRIATRATNALPHSPQLQTAYVQLGIAIEPSAPSACPPEQALRFPIEPPLSGNKVEEVPSCP